MDRIEELAIFVAIVDAGSLAGAARRLRKSRPAVTRALAGLEERVGTQLIARTTRRLTPNDAGRELATSARRLLTDYEAALGVAAAEPVSGLLRITAPLSFGRRHVTPLVNEFLDRYPQVQVELVLADRNLDLIEEDLQLAVRIGPLPNSGLLMRKVGEVRRILVAAPSYLAGCPPLRRPADIAAHETIASVAANQTLTWRFGGPRSGSAVVLTPRLIVNEVESVLIAARAGRGLARVLSYQAADDLAAGTLLRLLPEFEPAPLPVQLVVPGGRQPPPRVRAFIDHAVARLPELAPIGTGGGRP
ncbi:LysR family transcriptional regulator [uncultured Bosea sp.]|uniref:LysR family transcriptional regulator n=1 Tax=uncultured Bosea sp. TaxID=211457 RepID=UPI00263A50AC|nr:LysR family transcriptional regulator [uncultured Bosea sp.]